MSNVTMMSKHLYNIYLRYIVVFKYFVIFFRNQFKTFTINVKQYIPSVLDSKVTKIQFFICSEKRETRNLVLSFHVFKVF